ncbi:putative F-box/LRR-repeat protein At5g02930 [Coffea arabica]|uniref:F-box/LRR-repeat protein At5g02930 n=1 Tax=Coffea arabica TaxID=13443 RepID=A0A6P6WGQ6_COFAR|nr:putative F-box/LRR-repeat protein At5g02930 [Coffea arabica]
MVDRISGLPDAVLCHILSHLPTKLAAATSVLLISTRWRYIFASVPNIDLQYRGSLPAFHDECDQEYFDASLEHVRFTKDLNVESRSLTFLSWAQLFNFEREDHEKFEPLFPDALPMCFALHLEFKNFDDTEYEYQLIEQFLRCGRALQRLTDHPWSFW